ncbi:hypothetical protein PROFUN_14075 [Planoprotostelium fungivorum]|uniref:Uncharacterized protein n=1 Tax=Planoprotostelium fungivorum TaxID=1890364 RepID=A0A2P6N212_9EUKA|nr:hypothetical protein PROFUN_14075 [Planoprotostelium fungivorum]
MLLHPVRKTESRGGERYYWGQQPHCTIMFLRKKNGTTDSSRALIKQDPTFQFEELNSPAHIQIDIEEELEMEVQSPPPSRTKAAWSNQGGGQPLSPPPKVLQPDFPQNIIDQKRTIQTTLDPFNAYTQVEEFEDDDGASTVISQKEREREIEQEIVLMTAKAIRRTQSDLIKPAAPVLSFAGDKPFIPALPLGDMKTMVQANNAMLSARITSRQVPEIQITPRSKDPKIFADKRARLTSILQANHSNGNNNAEARNVRMRNSMY